MVAQEGRASRFCCSPLMEHFLCDEHSLARLVTKGVLKNGRSQSFRPQDLLLCKRRKAGIRVEAGGVQMGEVREGYKDFKRGRLEAGQGRREHGHGGCYLLLKEACPH